MGKDGCSRSFPDVTFLPWKSFRQLMNGKKGLEREKGNDNG